MRKKPKTLADLISGDFEPSSLSRSFRKRYELIEQAIEYGYPIKYIVSVIAAEGVVFKETTFRQYLYRERLKRKKSSAENKTNIQEIKDGASPAIKSISRFIA